MQWLVICATKPRAIRRSALPHRPSRTIARNADARDGHSFLHRAIRHAIRQARRAVPRYYQARTSVLHEQVLLDAWSRALLDLACTGWKHDFGKEYATAHDEVNALLEFSKADLEIQVHNANPASSWIMGHTTMSDGPASYTPGLKLTEEYLSRPRNIDPSLNANNVSSFTSSLDWAAKGKVTSVDQQGSCGCCWAFSAAGAIESARAIAGGPLAKLSKEELINCDMNANGCGGSHGIDEGLRFAQTHGLTLESKYPFTSQQSRESSGHDGKCNKAKESEEVVKVSGVYDVKRADEGALMQALHKGPVSVGIYAARGSPLQRYKGGVIDDSGCSTQNDHAVLLVGYGYDSASGKDCKCLPDSKARGPAGCLHSASLHSCLSPLCLTRPCLSTHR